MTPGLLAAFAAMGFLGIIIATSRWRRLCRFRSGARPLPPAAIQLGWLIARVCAVLGTTSHTALKLIRAAERLSASGFFLRRRGEGWPEELWAEALAIHAQHTISGARMSRACFYLAALLLPASARGRYLVDWLGEIDGLSPWRQIRFSIRVLLRVPMTAHVEGSYARLARASVAWAFPREGVSGEMLTMRISEIYRWPIRWDHKPAHAMGVIMAWAWTALGARLGVVTKPSDNDDGPR